MIRFGALFLTRSLRRVAALAVVLAVVSTIAMLFAWMGPSMQRAELAVWERLPSDTRIDHAATAQPGCLPVYQGVAVTRAGSGARPVAHPDLVVAEDADGLLGTRLTAGNAAIVDGLAATAAGLANGDGVEIAAGPLNIESQVITLETPTKLHRVADGIVVLPPGVLPSAAPPPDDYLCLGTARGATVASILAEIEARQAADGVTSATMLFAALALVAWSVVLGLAVLGVVRRGRPLRALLDGMGTRPVLAWLMSSAEVAVGGAIGIAISLGVTWWLRLEVLRMWTDPTVAAATGSAFFGILAALWLGPSLMARRLST